MIYLLQVFRQLEYPAEVTRLLELNSTVNTHRQQLIDSIVNNSEIKNLSDLVYIELKQYEKTLQNAFLGGLEPTADGKSYRSLEELEKWTILSSVFFSSSVLTTIGGCSQVSDISEIFRKN